MLQNLSRFSFYLNLVSSGCYVCQLQSNSLLFHSLPPSTGTVVQPLKASVVFRGTCCHAQAWFSLPPLCTGSFQVCGASHAVFYTVAHVPHSHWALQKCHGCPDSPIKSASGSASFSLTLCQKSKRLGGERGHQILLLTLSLPSRAWPQHDASIITSTLKISRRDDTVSFGMVRIGFFPKFADFLNYFFLRAAFPALKGLWEQAP